MYSKIGEFTPDNLIVGNEMPVLVEEIKLVKDQGIVRRGTVLGVITASGLAKPVDSTKTDGTEAPYAILTDDIDTTGTIDVTTTGYTTGIFNKEALIFGGTDDSAKHKVELRRLGIHLK